ncbi:hypothetical protein GBW32_07005 [Streptomyces tsukubensis]|nr:hypothetical protein GBW32_07005 [Streptomyces tsukubensis]
MGGPASTEGPGQADGQGPPCADCIADSAGGLTFDLADPGGEGIAHLLLRRRVDEDEVRLPLTPTGDGRLRAALPSTVELAEGRWDAYAELYGAEPERLVLGVGDLRSLLDRSPSGSLGHVAVRIPYVTKYGNLTVRSWRRAPHAEAGEIHVGTGTTTVSGRLYGTQLGAGAYAEARYGADGGAVRRAEATGVGAEFTIALDHPGLAESARGDWQLWLRPSGESGPEVRLARLLDDVVDKRQIYTYPAVVCAAADGSALVGPAFTQDNDLVIRVVSVSEGAVEQEGKG